MVMIARPVERLRRRAGHTLFTAIAGPDGYAARSRIHDTPGPRWFAHGSPIHRVHGDASTFVGGLGALLLQSLHPLAMAGVAGHSGYRGDPWGRLARTSTFLAYTTFATAEHAEQMIAQVRAVHERVRGRASDGRLYRASDPRLLLWVHVAEARSFLDAHQRYGERPLTASQCDEYVSQSGRVAEALGAEGVPRTTAELQECIDGFRPELAVTAEARDTAAFLLAEPPLPRAARAPYSLLAAGAVTTMPPWAADMLGVRTRRRRLMGGPGGAVVTRTVRWAMGNAQTRPPHG